MQNHSHFDATLSVNKHNITEFGQTVLQDRDTPDQWWSQHDGVYADNDFAPVTGRIHVLAAGIDAFAPAKWVHEDNSFTGSLREPDFYDEGKAFWLTPEAVVSIDIERIEQIEPILAVEPRIQWHDEGIGWTRIHPSHYGIEVDALTGVSHSAHEAWSHIAQAVKA